MRPIRVLFLTEGRNTPSSRLRVLNYLPFLPSERFEVQVRPIPNSIFSRPGLFRAANRADVVFVQKKLFRPWEIIRLRGQKGLVYDFDDMVMLPGRDKYRADQADTGRRKRFDAALAAADRVIAGSGYLKKQVGSAKDKTVVIPTTVDTRNQPVKTVRESRKGLILGWIGTKGNLKHLDPLAGAFNRLAQKFPRLSLEIICDDFIEPPGVETVKKHWELDREATDLLDFDVGLMPLADDPWTRGKCGFKIVQYMAAGLPTVASPVGVNPEIVRDGENGFLARDPAEWEDRLEQLLASASLRRMMGAAGRRTAERDFDLSRWSGEFARVLERVGGRG